MTPRITAAGIVEAEVERGTLTLVGDAAGARLHVDQTSLPAGSLRITPQDGTTLNGGPDAVVFSGVTDGLAADLGEGNNWLTLDRVAVPGEVRVTAGDGDNIITLVGAFGDVVIKLGAGRDVLNVYGDDLTPSALGDLTLRLGAGENHVSLDGDLTVAGSVSVKAKDGLDSIHLGADVPGDLALDLGDGGSFLAIHDGVVVGGNLMVKAKDGSDFVDLGEDAVIGGSVKLDLGAGEENTLDCWQNSRIVGPLSFTAKDGSNGLHVLAGARLADVSVRFSGRVGQLMLHEESIVDGSVTFRGRGGRDQFYLHDAASIAGDLTLTLGGGVDYAFLNADTYVGGSVTIAVGAGDDRVGITRATVQGDASVTAGAGADSVRCRDSAIGGDLTVKAGAGDDDIDTLGMDVAGTTTVLPGGGTNAVVP